MDNVSAKSTSFLTVTTARAKGAALLAASAPHAGLLLCAMSVLLAAGVYFGNPDRVMAVSGDEPHYLIMADSIVQDRTFNLRSAYARNNTTHHIFPARLSAHARIVRRRWIPYHGPGLPLIVALPFYAGGIMGAKLALCALSGSLALALYFFFSSRLSTDVAMWLGVGFIACLPFVFGATQIYPDFVGGLLATALAVWLVHSSERQRRPPEWALFWLAAGVFPWLNTKYFGSTVILTLWATGIQWQRRREGTRASRTEMATSGFVLIGILGLAAFHYWGVGNPLGPRRLQEIASPFSRAAAIFLGLHFDQSQGMFMQHPLLLAGVAAFPVFAWRRPLHAFFWLGLYASLLLPNSLELARWGGGGPVGRFAWSAEWLWAIPVGFAVAELRTTLVRFVKPVIIASLVYQVLLALRWWGHLRLLFPRLEEALDARDSLFPLALRPFVPSFYFWDFASYWTYPPNLAAFALVLGLLALGAQPIFAARRIER